jgi:hypothetical protein
MNVLLYLGCGMNSPAIKRLLEKMDVSLCAYFYEERSDQLDSSDVKTLPLYAFESLDFFCKNESEMLPLDAKVLEGMRPYAMTALDIINRWKKSITIKDSYVSLRDIYMIYLRYWNNFLLTNKINFVYFQGMPHIPHTYFIYALCKIHNIPILMQNYMPFIGVSNVNHILMVSVEEQNSFFSNRFRELRKLYAGTQEEIPLCPELAGYFENYSQKPQEVKAVIIFKEKNTVTETLRQYINRARIYIASKRYRLLVRKAIYFLGIKHRDKRLMAYIETKEKEPELSSAFLFFPLQMQPECTTLPCGGVFADQLEAVRLIAASLPDGFLLYVKEHPVYWRRSWHEGLEESRNRRFYDNITALENVRLIRHDYSSLELIDKCTAVVTITGTAGFEAIFRGKPVLLFGPQFYSEFPGVFRIRQFDDCKRAVNQIVNGDVQISSRDLRIALKSVEPFVITMPIIDKGFVDSGGERLTEDHKLLLIDAVIRFAKDHYNFTVQE